MKKALIFAMFVILLAGFVLASEIAPSPTCKINAQIQNVSYKEAYYQEDIDGRPCIAGGEKTPAKYLLKVKISGVSTVNDEGYETCEELYPINTEQTLTIYKSEIESAHTFEKDEFLEGNIHLSGDECQSGIYLSNYATFHIEEKIKQLKNRLQIHLNATECPDNCTCAGSTIKCWINGQREMTVVAGRSGNVIVQVKGVNASTNVTLYKSEGKLYGVFEGNETKRIMTPEQVQEKIREKKQKRWEEHNITLDEDGYYRVQSKKKARLFLLIPVREKVRTQIDAETGEIVRVRNPWWGFLARDMKEEPLVGASCGTVTPGYNDECCVNKGYDAWDAEAVECIFNE